LNYLIDNFENFMFKKTGPQIGVQCNAKPLYSFRMGGGGEHTVTFFAHACDTFCGGPIPTLTSENKIKEISEDPSIDNTEIICSLCTDKIENQTSLLYNEFRKGRLSYMTNSLLIYG
jgi:hypothetical protein